MAELRPYRQDDILLAILLFACHDGFVHEARSNATDAIGGFLFPRYVGKNTYNAELQKAVANGFIAKGCAFHITDAGRAEFERQVDSIQPVITNQEMLDFLLSNTAPYLKTNGNYSERQFAIRENQLFLTAVRRNFIHLMDTRAPYGEGPDDAMTTYVGRIGPTGMSEINRLKTIIALPNLISTLRTVNVRFGDMIITVYATPEEQKKLDDFANVTYPRMVGAAKDAERDQKELHNLQNGLAAIGRAMFGRPGRDVLFGPSFDRFGGRFFDDDPVRR